MPSCLPIWCAKSVKKNKDFIQIKALNLTLEIQADIP